MSSNLLLINGRVFDGNGNPWYKANILIDDGKIAQITTDHDLNQQGIDQVIDLEGKSLCPGFIDVHSHSDCNYFVDPLAAGKLQQGVTTELVGNCGVSAVPFNPDLGFSAKVYEAIGEKSWETFASYFQDLYDNGLPLNLASLVGHGSLRTEVVGFKDKKPCTSEMDEMKEILNACMEDGAFGLSTGLYYAPGSYASTAEVIELAKVVSEHGGLYASHIRNEGVELLASVKEAIEIGEKAKLPVEISHHKAVGKENWGKVDKSLRVIRQARKDGIDVTADQYPYNASSTSLSSLLPRWAQQGGREKMLDRLKDSSERKKIKSELGSTNEAEIDWTSIYIVELPDDMDQDLIGKNIQEIASQSHSDPLAVVIDLLIDSEAQARQIHFGISKEDIKKVMAQPFVMVGSDGSSLSPEGPLSGGKPHPRSYGTFPRVLGKYVREEGTISLEDAIRKMTSLPAQRIGLKKKGRIREGMDADIVVFSPEEILDRADFQDPHRYPDGISYVIVNGEIALQEGQEENFQAGRVLKINNT